MLINCNTVCSKKLWKFTHAGYSVQNYKESNSNHFPVSLQLNLLTSNKALHFICVFKVQSFGNHLYGLVYIPRLDAIMFYRLLSNSMVKWHKYYTCNALINFALLNHECKWSSTIRTHRYWWWVRAETELQSTSNLDNWSTTSIFAAILFQSGTTYE